MRLGVCLASPGTTPVKALRTRLEENLDQEQLK